MRNIRIGLLLVTIVLAGTAAERKTALVNEPEEEGAAPLLTPGVFFHPVTFIVHALPCAGAP